MNSAGTSLFGRFVGRGVVVGMKDGKDDITFCKGLLAEYDDPWLFLRSRGRVKSVRQDMVVSIKETSGVVP
jgi:hypothetical protein